MINVDNIFDKNVEKEKVRNRYNEERIFEKIDECNRILNEKLKAFNNKSFNNKKGTTSNDYN